jgi:MATE family multidrug resistance protein
MQRGIEILSQWLADWRRRSRYREVANICVPLVMGTAATTVMEFTDRVFLANYSLDAIAAATPSGIAAFLFLAFFGGVAAYISVFIAQYKGAGASRRIGAALWQGIYFSISSGCVLAACSLFMAEPIFSLAGHPQHIQSLEAVYFKILCIGSVFHISVHALSAFFTGRGVTRPVMVISFLGMAFNIPLDYVLINGIWIFPELGIAGAAIATVSSWALMALLFSMLIFTSTNEKDYAVVSSHRLETGMFLRLMKFGIPGSMQFCLDVFAFTFFIFMVGRIGTLELAATSIVLSISSIAFMPAMGFSQGISTLVGQALGRKRPDEAKYATLSAMHLLLFYTLLVDLLFIFAPEKALSLFMIHSQAGGETAAIMEMGCSLLHIVAIYLFMDAMYMSFVGVLKGAGDTRFVMWSIGIASLCFMIGPLYIGVHLLQMGVVYAWMCVLAFITSLFLLSFYRYRQGKWKHMLVTGSIPHGEKTVL